MSSDPLHVSIPYTFPTSKDFPTEVMAERFKAWMSIIKDLMVYLREFVLVQGEIVQQQKRLQSVVGNSNEISQSSEDDPRGFFLPLGNGSIHDIPLILSQFHQQNIANGQKTYREVSQQILPKLEELCHDLSMKIKEIKNLHSDFNNNLHHELQATKQALSQFNAVMSQVGKNSDQDPYLAKARLDAQLRAQIKEETYLYRAYQNLQESGEKLESIVVSELQTHLKHFLELVTTEASSVTEFLAPNLINGFLAKDPKFEWDSYISRNLPQQSNINSNISSGKFIDLSYPPRKVSDLQVPHHDSVLGMSVREGALERRSKYLKSYSPGWYVLTAQYFHEFKTKDRKKDPNPVMSLALDSCQVSEHSKDGPQGPYKFILSSKSSGSGIMHRNHNWVFRTTTYQDMIEWYTDIKQLSQLSGSNRIKWVEKHMEKTKSQRISRASSILSGGSSRRPLPSQQPRASMDSARRTSTDSYRSGSIRQRPMSQATSMANANRLSSTFSTKQTQSPRISNMINSDGTAITPVDTVASGGKDIPPTNLSVSPAPVVGQTFYDSANQQYYTITPVAPPGTAPVQPQYFPTSPQLVGRPGSPSYFFPSYPVQPVAQPVPQPAFQPVSNQGLYDDSHRKSVSTLESPKVEDSTFDGTGDHSSIKV